MNLHKNKNQINFIKPKRKFCREWTKYVRIFVFAFFILATVISLQGIMVNVLANIENLRFTISHLDFGLRFPGEETDKYFTVEFVDSGNPDNYSISTHPKPLLEEDKEHCRNNPADYEKCYRDLCDHLTISSMDSDTPLDILTDAWVGEDDRIDTWQVHLRTPAIAGMVAQEHGYGVVDSSGDFGCDIAIEIEGDDYSSISGCKYNDVNNNGIIDQDEDTINGWEIQLIGCPYLPSGELLPISYLDSLGSGDPGACSLIATTTTSNGCYEFAGLDSGNYGVAEVQRENWLQTLPAGQTFYYFNLPAGEATTTIDFANHYTEETGSICGIKFYDYNLDGEMNGEDYGLYSWTINLFEKQETEQLVDIVTVYAIDGAATTSNIVLNNGDNYRIEASGAYFAGGENPEDIEADAKYSQDDYQASSSLPWTDSVRGYESEGTILLNLLVDGAEVDWGDYSADHIYSINMAGSSSTVEFLIYDIYYPNNTGSLTVKIYKIVEQTVLVDHRITDSDPAGHYCFTDIEAGNYILGEVLEDDEGWTATAPINPPYYEFTINQGDQLIYNFGNYKPGQGGPDTYCGDGIKQSPNDALLGGPNNDGYEACDGSDGVPSGKSCTIDCKLSGGGGGGGGGGETYLTVHDEQVSCISETSVLVSWRTNKYATSRVVYDTKSHPSTGLPPNYGYASSTAESADKVTIHSMTIENLGGNILYYFKPISSASPEVLGKELSFNMADCCGPIVLGEEGAPELTISKTVNKDFANSGDTVIYKVNIANIGNMAAYNTVLTDTLPAEFAFIDGGGTLKTWQLGDIEPGQEKITEYEVSISATAATGIYANIAQASADNHEPISASVDVSIELAATGFSVKELMILILALVALSASAIILRRKYL